MRLLGLCLCLCLAASAASAANQAVSADLIRLHDELHLTSAQEGAWRDYTMAIGASAQAEDRHRAADQLLPQLQTPRRIALIEANMARDEADFHRQGEAVVAFYQQLTPAQQKIFDAETLPRAGGRAQPDRPEPPSDF